MKISILMAACNQGTYLKETVESAIGALGSCRDWEILIADDHSTDNCCSLVEQNEQVRVFKHEEKLGVSHARHWLGEMATGDVIITTDTHYSYPRRSLWRMAHWALRQRAIILPVTNFQSKGKDHRVEGGELYISHRGLRIERPKRLRQWPSLFGGLYLMRRDVWDWLGGWIRLPGYWGAEEQIMTLLAYRFGIPIMVLTNHVCTHREYRQHGKYPFELPAHHPIEIAHYIHAVCFPDTYLKVWKPMLDIHYPGYEPTADPEPLRQWIDTRSVWDEHRVIETVLGCRDLMQNEIISQVLAIKAA